MKTLFVFDFDYTLIDDNVDTYVMSVRPGLNLVENLHTLRKQFSCWTDMMEHAFHRIHEQGVTKTELLDYIGQLRLYDQAMKAVTTVGSADNADAIILSDANTEFIEHILSVCGVRQVFKQILSNPSHFDPQTDHFHIRHFHSHSCATCHTPNICKGRVLTEYLKQESDYDKVVYIGDGQGDYCPALHLKPSDVLICRQGYALAKLVSDQTEQSCKAKVYIIDFLKCLGETVSECI